MPQPLIALRRPWHRIRRPIRREHTLTAIWLGTIGAVEVLGRRSTSDFGDVVGVTTLIILAVVTHYAHFMRPIPLISRLSQRVRSALEGLERYLYRAGEDLRLDPPLPRRFPGVLVAAGITAPLVAALLWTVRDVFPTGVRDSVLPLSSAASFATIPTCPTLHIAASLTRPQPRQVDREAPIASFSRAWAPTPEAGR